MTLGQGTGPFYRRKRLCKASCQQLFRNHEEGSTTRERVRKVSDRPRNRRATAPSEGCGGGREMTGPTAPTRPSGPTYTISGVITQYRGGPVSGAEVEAVRCSVGAFTCDARTQTDQQGHYSLSSPSAGPIGLVVGKEGYQPAWKISVSALDSTANFVLHPSVMTMTLNPNGDVVAGTVSGDEFMAGDDVIFGGLCAPTACRVIEVASFVGAPRQFELRLRWNDPTRQLALLVAREDDDFFNHRPADRYCCSSEIIATVYLSGYIQRVAVAFEQAMDRLARPTASSLS